LRKPRKTCDQLPCSSAWAAINSKPPSNPFTPVARKQDVSIGSKSRYFTKAWCELRLASVRSWGGRLRLHRQGTPVRDSQGLSRSRRIKQQIINPIGLRAAILTDDPALRDYLLERSAEKSARNS